MAYGTEQRMWTLEEYIEKFEQLQAAGKRLKEELESMLYQFAGWNDAKGGFTTNGLSALESAFDTLGWDDPHINKFSQCDEPGCKKRGTCGWGPKDKRRRTCSTHYIEATRPK